MRRVGAFLRCCSFVLRSMRLAGAFLRCCLLVWRSMRLVGASLLLKQARVAAGCRLYEWWQRDFADGKRQGATVGHEIDPGATNCERLCRLGPNNSIENELQNPREKTNSNASITPYRTPDGDERRVGRLKGHRRLVSTRERGKLRLASLPGVEQQNTAQRIYHSHPASREAHGRTQAAKASVPITQGRGQPTQAAPR